MTSTLDEALRAFEATEANLAKLERLWAQIEAMIPQGVCFYDGSPEERTYDDLCRSFFRILDALPAIDGFKIRDHLVPLNGIAQARLDYMELGEPEDQFRYDADLRIPGKDLQEYRFRFNAKRRDLTRRPILDLIDSIDEDLRSIRTTIADEAISEPLSSTLWDSLTDHVSQIDTLLGGSSTRPSRWSDLRRHLRFAQIGDFEDICRLDWPSVKAGLGKLLYAESDPLPVGVNDLGALVATHPAGPVATKLNWERLSDEEFERLIFCLISDAAGYENPEWLTKTNAPDRGRDLSVVRVSSDELSGVKRDRVIIQCKHWLSKSVAPSDISALSELIKLWEPPRVDVLVIATSGRFTSDAVQWIEKHNSSNSALTIGMWPDSHLELLIAKRPAIIAEFGLR